MKTKAFENSDKNLSYTVTSIGVLRWTMGENVSKSVWSMEKRKKKEENATVGENILLRFRWEEKE